MLETSTKFYNRLTEKENIMKKTELQDNVAVKIDDEIYLTSLSLKRFVTKDGFMYLDDYDEDLKYIGKEREWDVSEYAIFDGCGGTNRVFDNGNSFLSWHKQEEETGDLTMSGEISIDCSWTEKFNKQIEHEKEILKAMTENSEFTFNNMLGTYTTYIQDEDSFNLLKPERVIYNDRATICYWKDGTKTVVKATDDDHMTHEHGVAMAIVRKLFPSRQEFLRTVKSGHDTNIKEE